MAGGGAADARKKTVAEIAGDLLLDRRQTVGDAAAERRGRPTGGEPLSKAAQRAGFWQRFLSPEEEQAMLSTLLAEGISVEQARVRVSGAVYKRRWELWAMQGELPDQLAWAKEMATLGPPETPAPPMGGQDDAG